MGASTAVTVPPPRVTRVPQATQTMPYLPGLDGLRALAVIGVVLYHLDLGWVPGGFLGVDVFFVLSGFLITTLVVEEVEQTGRLDFKAFYRRRARRLLPALWLLLLTVSATALVFVRDEVVGLREDVVAALLYVSNWWYVVAEESYFEFVGRPNVLQHLWSLAVEEQFYLLWPAILVVAMTAGRRRVRRVALIGALLSTTWMMLLAVRHGMPVPTDPSRVYFGTDTHAMGLLLGAALAASWSPWRRWSGSTAWVRALPGPRRRGAIAADLAGLLALAGVVWAFWRVSEFSATLYRGGFLALAAVTALLVASLAHPGGLLGRAMAVQPLRYLGERSYGIYLWHWPIFMVTRPGFELGFDGWPAVTLRVGLTLLVAELSYRFVELPVRRGAIGRAFSRARVSSVDGLRTAVWLATVTGAVALVVWTVGLGMSRVPDTGTTDDAVAAAILPDQAEPDPGPLAPEEPTVEPSPLPASPAAGPKPSPDPATTPGPTPAVKPERTTEPTPATEAKPATEATPATEPKRQAASKPAKQTKPTPKPAAAVASVSAFGDSVIHGAQDLLRGHGVAVRSGEALHYPEVFDRVRTALDHGKLGRTVVLHVGNNGPIAEDDLRALLDDLAGRRVLLVNLHLPRSWESYNNTLLAEVAADYRKVKLLDWHTLARTNPGWLYQDRIHLAAPQGRQAYTTWLLDQAR